MLLNKQAIVLIVCLGLAVVQAAPTKSFDCDFNCGDGQCISSLWRCDNVKDCKDGSDEFGCNYLHECGKKEFMCLNGECIPAKQKCDGNKDCSDGTDERACSQKGAIDNLPSAEEFEHDSSHAEIQATPSLANSPKPISLSTATQCVNRPASLYFINGDSAVHSLRISDSIEPPKLLLQSVGEKDFITSLAYSQKEEQLLATTKRFPSQIQSLKKDGNLDNFASHPKERFGRIAVDPLTQNIYFAEDGFGIGVCDKNAENCVTLIEAGSHEHRFHDLLLHTRRGFMIWIQDEPQRIVKIASMDGKNPRHLSEFGPVYSISLDADSESLYVADENSVVRLNLDTMSRTEVAQVRASSLLYYNCDLFYIQRDLPSLRVIHENVDKLIMPLSGSTFSLALAQDVFVIDQPNPCDKAECPEICALAGDYLTPKASCLCNTCGAADVVEPSSSTLTWFITLFLVLLLLTLIVMFLVVYFRLWPELCDRLDGLLGTNAHNNSNISVGFTNAEQLK